MSAEIAQIRPGRRITMRDDTLPHQIRIYLHTASGGKIAVSCNCRPVPCNCHYTKHSGAHMAEVGADA